ncbi:hypothetical protein [Novosphingobium pokkalii]|jgi:hypothetical protein|uniref:Uncharacterized protein n=1 Tax=Novosphingobium pokkalii TaxID=1770194 RepID=A0ABV7V490_9SPHN|nr:hypothetical protein [Novosphingobium pokkalii]GHC91109.1 hypothetical protein GCM10019060_15870 [Novosphingobium pokkalii]
MNTTYSHTPTKLHTPHGLPATPRVARVTRAPGILSRQELRDAVAQMVG